MSQYYSYEGEISESSYRSFYLKTYGKMALGLLITAAVAFVSYIDLINNWGNSFTIKMISGMGPLVIIMLQLGLAMFMNMRLTNMSATAARLSFFAYCAITGITFSILPLSFGVGTVFTAVAFTAVLFINLLIIGITTKVDITRFSGILLAGLITMIVMSFASFFIRGTFFAQIYDYIGVFVFMGLTAWDAQNLKRYYVYSTSDRRLVSNFATFAAFQLYLDFINLFLRILSIFARNKDN